MSSLMRKVLIIWLTGLLSACSGLFQYSPFDMDVSSSHINSHVIAEIEAASVNFSAEDTLSFAVFSDTHENYDILADALDHLNARQDIAFIINNGDVTNSGFAREYKWYIEIIEKSVHPLITVLGNHDSLANGKELFERLFGPVNFTFVSGAYKFILFNNNIWENQDRSPDYLWLRDQLSDESYNNLFFAHMNLLAKDINELERMIFEQVVDSVNTVFAGYASAHEFLEYHDRGIHSMISASIDKREYAIIRLIGREATIERVNF
jgi:3',5'-cyclic-AMP phosphodiesterase